MGKFEGFSTVATTVTPLGLCAAKLILQSESNRLSPFAALFHTLLSMNIFLDPTMDSVSNHRALLELKSREATVGFTMGLALVANLIFSVRVLVPFKNKCTKRFTMGFQRAVLSIFDTQHATIGFSFRTNSQVHVSNAVLCKYGMESSPLSRTTSSDR